ncbi:MAG: GNAT family N-acetyltransferase [Agathobacter sp.]
MEKNTDLKIERIPYEHYIDYSRLSDHVHSLMEHKERYVPCTGDWFDELTEENSILMGIYDNQKLIAGFLALVPSDEENYANYLDNHIDLDTVIHMETAAVHENYRGQHLQEQLMLAIEPLIFAKYPKRVNALCTVHPENSASLRNVEHAGYQNIAFVPNMYDNERYIYYKRLPYRKLPD